jgi:hypothetical protein
MTDTVTLKPCPFCGGVAKFVDDPGVCDVPFGLVVDHSGDCFFDMSLCTDAKQIERWNTRASSTASSVGADALAHLESEARRFAGFYKPNSDMANTLNILGNKIAALAAISTAQVDETERVTVPREPTEAMYLAAFNSDLWGGRQPIRRVVDEIWDAMLRAALAPEGDAR